LEEAAVSIFRVKWAHLLYPEDGDNNFIWNAGNYLPNCMSYPKRPHL
jgi:hypothetical protein